MTTDRVKIITYITQGTDQKVEAFMARAGMTKSKTCAMALQLEMEALKWLLVQIGKIFLKLGSRPAMNKIKPPAGTGGRFSLSARKRFTV